MLVTQEVVFVEDSGQASGYSAAALIPANATLSHLGFYLEANWNDSAVSGAMRFQTALGPSGPLLLDFKLNGSYGPSDELIGTHNIGDEYAATYPSARTLNMWITGANNDGSSGRHRYLITYYLPEAVPVVRG